MVVEVDEFGFGHGVGRVFEDEATLYELRSDPFSGNLRIGGGEQKNILDLYGCPLSEARRANAA